MSQATIQQEGGSREAAIASCQSEVVGELWPEGTSLDYEVASQDDDSAIVNVEATIEGETATMPLGLVVEDGTWKIDSTTTPEATATAGSETVVPDDVEVPTADGGP